MEKCPACGTRGVPHAANGVECLDMQYERKWKNKEDAREHDDLDVLA